VAASPKKRWLIVDLDMNRNVARVHSGECSIFEGETPEKALAACLNECGWEEGCAEHWAVIPVTSLVIYQVDPRQSFEISVKDAK
jgi:hypothetical protein